MKTKQISIVGEIGMKKLVSRLAQSNEHYTVTTTPTSKKFHLPELKLTYMCTPDFMSNKHWGTFASIKSHLKKSGVGEHLPRINPREITYFNYCKELKFDESFSPGYIKEFSNIVEMDISAAYVNAAKILNILDTNNFKKLIEGDKSHRLKILGALASRKLIDYYHGKELINSDIKVDEMNRNAWFNIVSYTDNVIKEVYLKIKKSAMFYYVDNIFLKNEPGLVKVVNDHFKSYGFQMKTFKLKHFIYYVTVAGNPVLLIQRENSNDLKTFNLPLQKISKYLIIPKA